MNSKKYKKAFKIVKPWVKYDPEFRKLAQVVAKLEGRKLGKDVRDQLRSVIAHKSKGLSEQNLKGIQQGTLYNVSKQISNDDLVSVFDRINDMLNPVKYISINIGKTIGLLR